MQNQYFSLNSSKHSLLKASLFSIFALNCSMLTINPCLATNFDMNDGSSTQSPANIYSSAGTGAGQNGITNTGYTNVKFSDFGFTPNPYPGGDTTNPADLLPINQQFTTTTGLPINS